MNDYIVLPSGEKLYNGAIVLLSSSETQKYILHFGLYSYEGQDRNGPCFVSIPDKSIVVPAEGEFLIGVTALSNGSSYFPPSPPPQPDPQINIATDDKSLEIDNSILQIKDFEKKYYKIEDNEETEVAGFSDNLRPITIPDGEDSYKLAWIKDKRIQEIDYENLDNAENEYPSIHALIQDKILELVDRQISPEDLYKNVTGATLFELYNVRTPSLWELKTGWYRASGTINVSPNESLSADSDRLILISNQQFADQIYVYSALIMPVNPPTPGFGRGMTQVACFYVKDSEDPEDFSYDYRVLLTSDIVSQTIVPSVADQNRIPSELAVVNYVDTLISAINGGSY